jgi:hypothetical protein
MQLLTISLRRLTRAAALACATALTDPACNEGAGMRGRVRL